MGQHGAPSRLRVDLIALSGLVFLVIALAVAVALSIIASSPRETQSGQVRPVVGSSTSTAPSNGGAAGLGR